MNSNLAVAQTIDRYEYWSVSKDGQAMYLFKIRTEDDLDVMFNDHTIVYNQSYKDFISGNIINPNHFKYKDSRLGEIRNQTNENEWDEESATIIRDGSNTDIDVQFEDGTIVKNQWYYDFLMGRIKKTTPVEYSTDNSRPDMIGESCCNMNRRRGRMTIIRYGSDDNIDVQFEDGTIVRNQWYYDFCIIQHPDDVKMGKVTTANCGLKMRIIRYGSPNDIDVEFEDGNRVHHKSYSSFKKGCIGHPYLKRKRTFTKKNVN